MLGHLVCGNLLQQPKETNTTSKHFKGFCAFKKHSEENLHKLCVYVLSRSVMSDSAAPWTVARQAPKSMGFSRQEYWSGKPLPSPGEQEKLNPGLLYCRRILYHLSYLGSSEWFCFQPYGL